jgi:hypothetical protein
MNTRPCLLVDQLGVIEDPLKVSILRAIASQLPAGTLAILRKEGDTAGHVARSKVVVL